MIVGVPKEVKVGEHRVGLVPAGARALVDQGHRVLVETGAGAGIGIADREYQQVGAEVLGSAEDVWSDAGLVVKVKEPQPGEYSLMRPEQILFTYLHLAACPDLVSELLRRRVTAVAYETVKEPDGSLPLLAPMSEVAGRLSAQIGAACLQKNWGGSGVLLGGIPGVAPGRVVVVGGGVVGTSAARIALGMGADVIILDVSLARLRRLDETFGGRVTTRVSTRLALAEEVAQADLVIGGVLVVGDRAPRIITREMVRSMRSGSALVDVAIDQGGCAETARPTTHDDPVYVEERVVHYCVTNIPALAARTATFGLTNATLPYVLKLAAAGESALADSVLGQGVNVRAGELTNETVARALGYVA